MALFLISKEKVHFVKVMISNGTEHSIAVQSSKFKVPAIFKAPHFILINFR